jgi:hypothetical protein
VEILSLDLARNLGWARGPAGKTPDSGSKELGPRGGNVGLFCGELGRWLRDHKRDRGVPDLLILERWIAPNRSMEGRTDKSIEVALRLNGAAHALMGGIYNVMIVEPAASTVRAAVCGRAHAITREEAMALQAMKAPGYKPSASAIRDVMRKETKRMVIRAMVLRKLLPKESEDDDRADALAGWAWAESVYGRRAPAEFVLS